MSPVPKQRSRGALQITSTARPFSTDYVHKGRCAWLDMRKTTGEPENELSSVGIESHISTKLKSVGSWHVKVTCRWRSLQFIIVIPQEGTDDNGVLNVNWFTWPVHLIASSAGQLCVCVCVCACVRVCVRACVCVCVRACVDILYLELKTSLHSIFWLWKNDIYNYWHVVNMNRNLIIIIIIIISAKNVSTCPKVSLAL